jgi:hypothetical protein
VAEVYGTAPRYRRRRRGRRLLITLLVLLLILLGVLFVGDRYAKSYAERMISDKVAEQVADQKATSEKPVVTIEGVPFLTQVLDGRYQQIRIELANFSGPAGNGRNMEMRLLDVRADDVSAPLDAIRSGNGDITAGRVTGTGVIDYPQLVTLIGQEGLTLTAKDGKLVGSAPVTVLGQTATVSGAATLTVKSGVVQVRFSNVTAEGLPDSSPVRAFINTYAKKLALDLKVPELPLKLTVQKVEPQEDGLHFTAGASDVALASSGL